MPATPPLPPAFAGLAPAAIWRHFATLCAFPRPSKAEGPLREHLRAWAEARGLATTVDGAGNLIIKKPASPGRKHAPGVVLQAHLDMVCQKNAGTAHDFSRDSITPRLADGWLVADDTTLGADNGIGVALILAALEDATLVHGPLEALLTVDEEAGMGGAHGLAADVLQGRLMLNLDTEDWGEFYLGCAGGLDVNVSRSGAGEPVPGGFEAWQIGLAGLRGGHSGVDIHEERGNAIKLLVRVLRALEATLPLRLAGLVGGTARNALPREARATLCLPAGHGPALAAALDGAFADGLGTRAVVVVKDGELIAERYADGFTKDTPQLGWSMAKSVTNLLVGRMSDQRAIALTDTDLRDDWARDERRDISVDDLLRMQSGLAWDETYDLGTAITKMLYLDGDMAASAAAQPLVHAPGTFQQYSSGSTNIVCDRLLRTTRESANLPRIQLFAPLGLTSAVWEPDASGVPVCSSYLWATPRDWAAIGQFALDDGVVGGARLLPEGWMADSTTNTTAETREDENYGSGWWLNRRVDGGLEIPGLPEDAYWASGHDGQRVFVVPSENLVIVRLGFSPGLDGALLADLASAVVAATR